MDVSIHMTWKEIIKDNTFGYTFKLDHKIPSELWDKIQELIEEVIKEDRKIKEKKIESASD
ncbi:hypothetical protein LCGC14_2055050 [marine sediment metagenome]|uniref:Uncharacterized protein n=1 Tax=marine sediment metagenome TaxID=412755 RepID=A0A0F9H1C0_9ZZZZ